MTKTKNERYASVWDALADTAEEAANLKVRAELMRKIASLIQERAGRRPRRRSVAASPSRASMICCVVAFRGSRSMRW